MRQLLVYRPDSAAEYGVTAIIVGIHNTYFRPNAHGLLMVYHSMNVAWSDMLRK